jgi:hypothetical protein
VAVYSKSCCYIHVRYGTSSSKMEIAVPIADGLTCSSVDVLRRTQYRTPVESLENVVLCCALFTKPYHSNDGAVMLRVCVAMGMLLHSNEHLQISTVADRLSMFATCGRIPWKALTSYYLFSYFGSYLASNDINAD